MKWMLPAALLVISALENLNAQDHNTLTRKEERKGWRLLFDGRTTTGWHGFRQTGIGEAWKAQDGALWLDVKERKGRGDIVTDAEFTDFHFTFDWKIAPKGNSGIIFLVQDRDPYRATWHTGPEYQLIDNENYPSKLDPRQTSASLYDLVACAPGLSKPAGEWNTGSIRLEKGRLEFHLNGKLAVSTMLWDETWDRLVAGSKFVREKDFARARTGRIAIQDHGGEVWMRNMKIREIK